MIDRSKHHPRGTRNGAGLFFLAIDRLVWVNAHAFFGIGYASDHSRALTCGFGGVTLQNFQLRCSQGGGTDFSSRILRAELPSKLI